MVMGEHCPSVLFGAFVFALMTSFTRTGLVSEAGMAYAFATQTKKTVETTANDMVKERMAQVPSIVDGSK